MRHGIHAPIVPGPRKPRYRANSISYWSLLAARMNTAPLVLTHRPGGDAWSVRGDLVNPILVRQAINSGHIIPRDPGLFGATDALTYQLNPTPGDRQPPFLPPTRDVERWVRRALRLKCVVCGNSVYANLQQARADIEQILGTRTSINDLKTALADTAHGGRLCHVHM
jgi:hypothetical protein